MKLPISASELNERIALNRKRFEDDEYYRIGGVFSPAEYDWPGDKEGRALLAFVCHFRMTGAKIACMDQMISALPGRLNEKGYMGEISEEYILEQQLSGHSWLLRGLCEYHAQFHDEYSLSVIRSIVENLYLPTCGRYHTYPIERQADDKGGVSGTSVSALNGWMLSSDVGCAFMSIDGLSHAYEITKDPRIRGLLGEMIEVFVSIDVHALRAQTHCTLTAGRGLMRLYAVTGDMQYLKQAEAVFRQYTEGGGMTLSFQNLNWWGRPDTWTEPCAIVDSIMLGLELYKATGNEAYRTLAARAWHNGMATAQRSNGGAGTDTVVSAGSPWDYVASQMYEAYFCCSMRLAEGLRYVKDHADLLWAETTGSVSKNADGVYMDGDIVYAEVSGGAEAYAEHFAEADGLRLCPLVKYYRVPREIMERSRQKIRFS